MATHKADLSEVSQSQLAELTGFRRETIRRRLEGLDTTRTDGRTLYYSPRTALAKIYGQAGSADLDAQKMRLAKEQADGQELKNKKTRAELIPASDNAATIIGLATLVSQRMQGVGPKVAPLAHTAETVAEAESIISEALTELADSAAEIDQEASYSTPGVLGQPRRGGAVAPAATWGRLSCSTTEDHWFTAEPPWDFNRRFKSCIPDGIYDLVRHDTPSRPGSWAMVGEGVSRRGKSRGSLGTPA